MYSLRSSLLILGLFGHIVYVKSQSNCTLDNLYSCCSIEGGTNARTFLRNQPKGINSQQVVKYYTDLCKFRTLYEKAAFIQAQYEKLSTVDLSTMFTTPKPPTTPTRPTTTRKSTIPPPKTSPKSNIQPMRPIQTSMTNSTRAP
ncbi:unnamed protein product [Schistosoma turkestanicum]|nr:unnamed protein product [Schistosoma turkestanicum]